MSTQYLSYGIVGGRPHSERDLELLRTAEVARAEARQLRRERRTAR